MRLGNNAGQLWYIIAMMLYKLCLDGLYVLFVNPVFAYAGYGLEVNYKKVLIGWGLYLGTLAVTKASIDRPSDFFQFFILASVVAPAMSMFGLNNESSSVVVALTFAYFVIFIIGRGKSWKLKTVPEGASLAFMASLLSVVSVVVWIAINGGFEQMNFDLTEVYHFRADSTRGLINSGIFAYLNSWVFKVFNIYFIVLAIRHRTRSLVISATLLQVLFFGVSNHKAVLFYPILVFGVWVLFGGKRKVNMAVIPVALIGLMVIAYYVWVMDPDKSFYGSLLIRRVFFVPAKLLFAYYEFFGSNPKVYWSNSILSNFLEYPYQVNTALVIGEHLGSDAAANNNFIATGYMHAGYAGLAIYAVLVGLLFRLLNSLAGGRAHLWVAIAIPIIPMNALIKSADLFAALLTHGVLISIVLLYLVSSSERPGKTKHRHLNRGGRVSRRLYAYVTDKK